MSTETLSQVSKIASPVARRIWGNPDTVLLFFAGGSAEFAAIKAVDWLFYTNRLPSSPIDRFFETMEFAQNVFLGKPDTSARSVKTINQIHKGVEKSRGMEIPQWAYKDVLFIILHYGERAHEVVFGPLSNQDRQSYFEAVMALGHHMHLQDLPQTYEQYLEQRKHHLMHDYEASPLTQELMQAYRKALGPVRYYLLTLVQACLIPQKINRVLGFSPNPLINFLLRMYHYLPGEGNKLRWIQAIILPVQYAGRLRKLAKKDIY
ncbi:oxygenase MpaB family protein [Rhodocytophaga aerolata]|uniref:Oxygenase MpaB family protein n=1 Tax=Rhodocytophaga aerolata TaxID=455078 RepID=A0ABT8R3J1_9BACT|nr:oxygenase MpaB family protein [Rhodocytophaga aerolata]MDO1445210.1 oxygenase MpaB family protein [Rhodocytophaga aerolata]